MLKDMTYQQKFSMLQPWLSSIIESVKKDLKNDHLKKDFIFCKEYLPGKNINKVTLDEMTDAYTKAITHSENAEALAEFISNRWLLKNSDLYDYFATRLSEINPNFSELDQIDAPRSREIVKGAIDNHGALKTYLFAVINSVVFPEEVYKELNERAHVEEKKKSAEMHEQDEKMSTQNLQGHYEQLLARTVDKYEKKISGLEKKYLMDTESLKKQIAALQRKMGKV